VIESVAGLGPASERLRVAFVGTGSREAAIRAAVARRGLSERVVLVGFADDVPSVLASLDVALYVPLESEGMSRVMFESLAAGRPLIAARVGLVPEILRDREHALLVAGGTPCQAAGRLGLTGAPRAAGHDRPRPRGRGTGSGWPSRSSSTTRRPSV
jgi:glycosyltransferase involved in cell wall biosynthesis